VGPGGRLRAYNGARDSRRVHTQDAKKDEAAKQAYRMLAAIHDVRSGGMSGDGG